MKLLNNYKFKDFVCVLTFVLTYLCIVFITTRGGKFIFGSYIDFSIQHYTIADYFRTLFYKTHDFFPDFAFNLGAGENIYFLSYYGLFNPIILVSYFFPKVSMLDYIIVAMAVVVLTSTIAFYAYLRKNKYPIWVCFISAFSFLCAAPIIFHSHRHIMFMDYFPFLILGLFGVDKYVEENKSFLLMLSIVLMIFTSYYFSVSGIIVLGLYSLFKYIRVNKYQNIMNFTIKLIFKMLTSILVASILLLPTAYTLFSGRTGETIVIGLKELLEPNMYMVDSTYSMGLTIVAFTATIMMLFSRKSENIILSFIILLISIFPIFNYILNGFLYINGKSLIPFIILVLINMSDCLLFMFKNNHLLIKLFLIILVMYLSGTNCLKTNLEDILMWKEEFKTDIYKNYGDYVKKTSKDNDNLYRINTASMNQYYINRVSDTSEYKTTVYSSTYNIDYKNTYEKTFENPLSYRNKFMIASDNNLIFQMYMGEKYIVSTNKYNSIYDELYSKDGVFVYKNDYVLPVAYATDKIVNKKEFSKLKYPDKALNMLGNIVVNEETNTDLIKAEKLDIDYDIIDKYNIESSKIEKGYLIKANENGSLKIRLNNDLKNKIAFVKFDILKNVSCHNKDLTIAINGISNKLTCKGWKYKNENNSFNYTLFDISDNTLNIEFEKGNYKIGNIEIYTIDFDEIKDVNKNIYPFIFDEEKTKGDEIVGTIDTLKDSYFTISIPYDKGFKVYVDDKKVSYQKVNDAFIGFKLEKGKHKIRIIYEAPYKKVGLIMSFIGIVIWIIIIFMEKNKGEIK